jgi:hypothetical protein
VAVGPGAVASWPVLLGRRGWGAPPRLSVFGSSALGEPPALMKRICARSNSGESRLPGKASQSKLRVAPDEGPHLAGQVERLGFRGIAVTGSRQRGSPNADQRLSQLKENRTASKPPGMYGQ